MAKNKETKQEIIVIDPYSKITADMFTAIPDDVNIEQFAPPLLKPKEHFGEVFGLVDYDEMEADTESEYDNDWMLLTVFDFQADSIAVMSTGSQFVMPVVRLLAETGSLPCLISFEKLGRSYKIVRANNNGMPF